MTNVGFLDVVRFNAASNGTGDFVVSSAVTGYQTPAAASAVDGTVYRYRAESGDLSQWEIGYGAYTSGSTTLARTTVLFSSTGSKVSFTNPPQVGIVFLAEDFNATGQIPGTSTNDNANAGNIGEIISSTLASGTPVSLTSPNAADVTSITLTPGDWDVWGNVGYLAAGGAVVTVRRAALSLVSATNPTAPNGGAFNFWAGSVTGLNAVMPTGNMTVSVASGTTQVVYLEASSTFTSTQTAYGFIGARRAR